MPILSPVALVLKAAPMAEKMLDARWQDWLRDNMKLGCDLLELMNTLRQAGFSDDAIAAGLDAVRPTGDAFAEGVMQAPPLIRKAPRNLRRFDHPEVELYILEDFLSRKESEKLVALISHHLRPSTVSFDNGDRYFRTSQTSHLSHLKSPVALNIDEKICKTIGIRAAYSEGIQAQRYDVGQQFKPHWDYFEPGTKEFVRFAGTRGNRTWTFMVYLNEGMGGGGTCFTELGHTFEPKTGLALLWNNLKADGTPNTFTKHSGEPVTSGHKIIITKWFRAIGEGPVFYE
jgi:prolyl 4-hydroxylase